MQILILGGTRFLGRAMVDAALARGHELTLFNRGQTNPDLYPQLEQIHGDRDGELEKLAGRRWNAVIDTSGYVPHVVRQSAEFLQEVVQQYVFISTISVYADTSQTGIDEQAPLAELEEETEDVTNEAYGPLKALCEKVVAEVLPGRTLVLRPGLIVGPHDPTDRFTYWPVRVARGGDVLAPGSPQAQVEFIDVRDLAEWTIRMVEDNTTGVYNATGPQVSMLSLLETCRMAAGREASFIWVAEDYLLARDVQPWVEIPLWLPESEPDYAGFFAIDSSRARAAGLALRPVRDTVEATLDWALTRPAGHEWRAGLDPAREAELLAEWRAQQV